MDGANRVRRASPPEIIILRALFRSFVHLTFYARSAK